MGFKISRNTSLKCGKIVYVDMDNVLVDFQSGLDRVPKAVKAEYADDCTGKPYILSTAPWLNPSAWSDKLEWVQRYFGKDENSIFYKRLIISHHKDLNRGDFLIDDREKNGAKDFKGELIQFGSTEYPDWPSVVKYLLNKIGY